MGKFVLDIKICEVTIIEIFDVKGLKIFNRKCRIIFLWFWDGERFFN